MGFQRTEAYTCDECELGTGPVEDEVEDHEDDPHRMPTGWMSFTVSIKLPNPDHAAAIQGRAAELEQQLAMVVQAQQTENNGQAPPAEQVQAMRAMLDRQMPSVSEAPFIVTETALHFCQEHALQALYRLVSGDDEAFRGACEELEIPLAPAQPQATPAQAAPTQAAQPPASQLQGQPVPPWESAPQQPVQQQAQTAPATSAPSAFPNLNASVPQAAPPVAPPQPTQAQVPSSPFGGNDPFARAAPPPAPPQQQAQPETPRTTPDGVVIPF